MLTKLRILLIVAILLIIVPTASPEFGSNWTAHFYDNTSFSGNIVSNITNINGLNFRWPGVPNINGITIPNVGEDNFSVIFSSSQYFSQARYDFNITFDDNVRVRINDEVVFEDFSGGPAKTRTFSRDMSAGTHALKVEFVEVSAEAVIQFQWFVAGSAPQATQTAPTAIGPTPTPGPTSTPAPTGLPPVAPNALSATVIRATVLNARSAPSLGAERVARLLRGQTYNVIGRDEDARWFLLQLSDGQAWAFGYYLAINGNEFNAPVVSAFVVEGNPAAVTGVVAQARAGLRLRAEPSVDSVQVGRITWGAVMPVTGRTGGDGAWWRVVWKGTEGWVFSPYMAIIEGSVDDIPTIQ